MNLLKRIAPRRQPWLALWLAVLPTLACGQSMPQPPCDTSPNPTWPSAAPQLHIASWHEDTLARDWQPPPCTGWQASGFSVLLAAAGRISVPGGSRAILARLGRVSQLAGLRYWSVSRDDWHILITEASALAGPDPAMRRGDFAARELHTGQDYFYWQQEPSTSGSAVYRLRLLEYTDQRVVISANNHAPTRLWGIRMLDAGQAQALYFFDRLQGDEWGYYQLSRIGHGRHDWLPITDASYANRASALFRWFAGLPEDAVPVWRD